MKIAQFRSFSYTASFLNICFRIKKKSFQKVKFYRITYSLGLDKTHSRLLIVLYSNTDTRYCIGTSFSRLHLLATAYFVRAVQGLFHYNVAKGHATYSGIVAAIVFSQKSTISMPCLPCTVMGSQSTHKMQNIIYSIFSSTIPN